MWETKDVRESTSQEQPSTKDCCGFLDKYFSSLIPGWDNSEKSSTLAAGFRCQLGSWLCTLYYLPSTPWLTSSLSYCFLYLPNNFHSNLVSEYDSWGNQRWSLLMLRVHDSKDAGGGEQQGNETFGTGCIFVDGGSCPVYCRKLSSITIASLPNRSQ